MAAMKTESMGAQPPEPSWTELSDVRRPPRGVGGTSRILVMENLRARGGPLRELLAQQRLEVTWMEDVRDAWRWLAEGLVPARGPVPAMLICNPRMLGEAGLGLLERWRQFHPGVPVLLLSAFESPRLRARLARLSGCLLLEQSFTLEDVCATALDQVAVSATS